MSKSKPVSLHGHALSDLATIDRLTAENKRLRETGRELHDWLSNNCPAIIFPTEMLLRSRDALTEREKE